jgi:arginyl-tRNA synthetase
MNIRNLLEAHFSTGLSNVSGISDCPAAVSPASRPEFGDYQVNGVMAAAKALKTNPRQLAQKLVGALLPLEMIERLEVAGPGFVNVFLSDGFLCQRGAALYSAPELLIPQTPLPQTIVVDYSSPNLAKEMHVGHLRGTIIGDSLVRVLERLGHKVIRQNHIGDWGTQFGMLIAHLQDSSAGPSELPTQLADLENFYRAAKMRFDSDSAFAELSRACVVRLQNGDPEIISIWKLFIEESLRHCEQIYKRLGIKMMRADLCAESFYNNRLPGIVRKLDDRGLLTTSEGARCVFLPEFLGKDGYPLPVIIQKSDGGFLYASTDLAAAEYRCKELHADKVLYVVDARQSLHFQQIFAVARLAAFSHPDCSLEHIAYGTMMGEDGKPFKTRSGDTIKLQDLLSEAVRRAADLLSSKNPHLAKEEKDKIAEVVGIAAVKYADLSKNRISDYVFDWDSMLSFEGNTAPYLLYAYTRIKSVLRKQGKESKPSGNLLISTAEERALLLKNLQLPEQLQQLERDYLPSQLCSYLYELAGLFMRFYESCPILNADTEIRNSRLVLAGLTAMTLQEGLSLLGLQTLEQM